MILLLALGAGLLAGLAHARWRKRAYGFPALRAVWLAIVGFLPQYIAFYLPPTRAWMPDPLAAASLILSQSLLLVFVWLNRRQAGFWLIGLGLAFNLAVIAANGGFMPISPQTAAHLLPAAVVQTLQAGGRFGIKDILLLPENTRLEWLADRFTLPDWLSYAVAFSLGDVLIAVGVFWLLARGGKTLKLFVTAHPPAGLSIPRCDDVS